MPMSRKQSINIVQKSSEFVGNPNTIAGAVSMVIGGAKTQRGSKFPCGGFAENQFKTDKADKYRS